jgi:hypothetical protein
MITWILIAIPVAFIAVVASAIVSGVRETRRIQQLPPGERAAAFAKSRAKYETLQWGTLSAQIVCPHCQSPGGVRTKAITRKAGVSGGKATAAILTGGVSLLAVGLSRKEASTEAHCSKCNATWHF